MEFSKLEKVFVKEWAGSVYLKVMSVGERDSHELDWLEHKEKGVANFRTKFLLKVLCDKNGKLLFTETHMPLLVLKSASVMNRLWEKAMKLMLLYQPVSLYQSKVLEQLAHSCQ
jgi:hypothetical protein